MQTSFNFATKLIPNFPKFHQNNYFPRLIPSKLPKFFCIHHQLNFRFFSIIHHYNRFNFTRINKSIYLLECSISSAILSTQVIARVRNPQSLRPHRSSNRASNNPAGSSVAQAIENDTNTELWISFNEYTWPSNEITVKHLQDSIGYLSRFSRKMNLYLILARMQLEE